MSDVTTNETAPQGEVVQRGSFALTVRRLRGDKASMAAVAASKIRIFIFSSPKRTGVSLSAPRLGIRHCLAAP